MNVSSWENQRTNWGIFQQAMFDYRKDKQWDFPIAF
jgi:hypothetical protein